jgi:hypothetical protein
MFSLTISARDFVKCDFLLEAVLSCFDPPSQSKMKSWMTARTKIQESLSDPQKVSVDRTLCFVSF